jgi:CubicO group peptidase (beta-lactamase class C family)
VTSVAGMQCVERGLITLDEDVRPIVPELGKQKVLLGFEGDDNNAEIDFQAIAQGGNTVDLEKIKPKGAPIFEAVKDKITLRQLMSHSAGLAYDSGHPLLVKWSAQQGRTKNMFTGSIEGATHPLTYQPGESWSYSPGLDWVGHIVEKLTKTKLDTYFQENIWKPLNAHSTTFHPTKHFGSKGMPPLFEPAQRVDNDKLADTPAKSPWPLDPVDGIGGAGLYSTADDYIKLLSCLLRGGAPLLKASSVDELFRPCLSPAADAAFRAYVETGRARIFRASSDDVSELMAIGHTCVGQVNLEDVPGRRKKGTVAWGGLPNLSWWIDRESGVAAVSLRIPY